MKAEKLILGNIYTMDEVKPVAKALTVAHGRIQYVGSVETARSLCGAKTEVLDYGENTIYPGFLEAHAHGVGKGIRLACHADVSAGTSYREYVQLMKEYIDAHPGKKFYMGAGWDVRFVEGDISFDRKALDAICPDVPCMLQAVDGHSSVCNTKLLDELGFDAEYARTRAAKGEMPVDEDGNPTGRLIETPNAIATAHIPVTLEELKEGILAWQELMFSKGYVGAVEAGNSLLSPQQDEAYCELSREGKLKLRAYSYYLMRESETDVEKTVRAAAQARREDTDRFKTVGIKIFLDGVAEAHSAWMDAEYSDAPGYFGVKRFCDQERLVKLISSAAKHDLGIHAHSIGDGATRFFLDAAEEAAAKTGRMDQRNCLAHLQYVRKEDIRRMADLNVIAIVGDLWMGMIPETYENLYVKYFGRERAYHAYPIRSLIDAGARVCFHTDCPACPLIDIPAAFFKSENRYSEKYGPASAQWQEETVTRMQAMRALTRNVAFQVRDEANVGSIEVGKAACLSVFDTDFLNAPSDRLMRAKVVATVVDGEEVYHS